MFAYMLCDAGAPRGERCYAAAVYVAILPTPPYAAAAAFACYRYACCLMLTLFSCLLRQPPHAAPDAVDAAYRCRR